MSPTMKLDGFHFRLAAGLNLQKDQIKDIMALWLLNHRLRQGIYQFDLPGDNYKALVAELRANWDGAVGTFKRKAMGEGVKKNDTSQTLVVAKQVRKLIEAYFEKHPKAIKDSNTIPLHIYCNSVFVVESIFEVQNGLERVFAKYVLDDSVTRVPVDELFFARHGEAALDLGSRELRAALELEFAASKKQNLEIRDLKSKLEVMDDLRDRLDASERDEQLALDKIDEAKVKLTEQIVWTATQSEKYEAKLEGLNKENSRLQGEVEHHKGRAMDAEKKLEELQKQLNRT